MSGLDTIGGIASIAQLAATVYTISKTLYEAGEALSNAPSDIKDLARDLETFSQELYLLSSLLQGRNEKYADQVYRLTAKIIGDCASICVKIDRILRKLRSGTFLARIKWLYKEKEIMRLLARLRDLKLSLMGTLSILSALRADHMMNALGVPNSSLIADSKGEGLSSETVKEMEETRKKLAEIAVSQESDEPVQSSSQLPFTRQISTDFTSMSNSSGISNIFSMNMMMQNPHAMESVDSFKSAVSSQTHDINDHRTNPTLEGEKNHQGKTAEENWRAEMVETAIKHFSMSYSDAESWAMKLKRPNPSAISRTDHRVHFPSVEEDQNLAPLFSMSPSTGSRPMSIPTSRDPVAPTLSSPNLAAENHRWRPSSPAPTPPFRIPPNHLPRKPSKQSYSAISGPIMPSVYSPGNSMALISPRLYGHHQGQQQQGQGYPFLCDECPQSFQRNANLKRHKQKRHQSTGRLFDHSVALLLSRS
jgi:hypothetical protein